MNLKNYTSGVPVDTTISRIERFLIDTGLVSGIAKEYAGNQVKSIIFSILYEKDKLPVTVKLPANVEGCIDFFWREHQKTAIRNRKSREDFRDQGNRTAWKLQQDWVEVQTSLIRLNQQSPIQAFMAYIWDGERTFYQRIKDSGFKQLAAPKSE